MPAPRRYDPQVLRRVVELVKRSGRRGAQLPRSSGSGGVVAPRRPASRCGRRSRSQVSGRTCPRSRSSRRSARSSGRTTSPGRNGHGVSTVRGSHRTRVFEKRAEPAGVEQSATIPASAATAAAMTAAKRNPEPATGPAEPDHSSRTTRVTALPIENPTNFSTRSVPRALPVRTTGVNRKISAGNRGERAAAPEPSQEHDGHDLPRLVVCKGQEHVGHQ